MSLSLQEKLLFSPFDLQKVGKSEDVHGFKFWSK